MMRSMRTVKKQTTKMRMKIAEYLKSLIRANRSVRVLLPDMGCLRERKSENRP